MEENAIETSNLSRRFGPHLAVDRLSLTVPAGSVFGFLGPNGAGKTTTIRLLLGLLKPDEGEIRLFGQPLAGHRLELLHRTGALVESPSLYPHLTGEENLRHACLLKDRPYTDIARVLEVVRLQADAPRLVEHYSLGMKQRLGLAQALLGHPELVILDEPTNGLDPSGIQEMRHLLRAMPASHGITVFLSSHLLGEVEQIATRVGIIAEGRLRFQGSPDELRARQCARLRIGVDRPECALSLLRNQGWEVSADAGGRLWAACESEAAASQLNRFLVERGFCVHSLSPEQATLEDLFLDLTRRTHQ